MTELELAEVDHLIYLYMSAKNLQNNFKAKKKKKKCTTCETYYNIIGKKKVIVLVPFQKHFSYVIFYSRDLHDVIRRANATRYGLAAGVFTKNVDTANTLSRALRAGTVWVNCFDVFDAAIPFGGYW
ncbi:unnamed protein product [Camellia sinensis]